MREIALDTLAVLLPTECAGCGEPDRSLCGACLAALSPIAREWSLAAPTDTRLQPMRAWAALDYDGPVRQALASFKDSGRTDVAKPLGMALKAAVGASLAASAGTTIDATFNDSALVELAAIPTSRQAFCRRGYDQVALLVRRAGYRAAKVLRHTRQTADQSELGRYERWENRAGSLEAHEDLTGRVFLIVDDILTTGATVLEAQRALTEAGARVAGAATVAHTRKLRQ